MTALDLRVPFTVLQTAFGRSATVTRPAPDDTPVTTDVVWMSPLTETFPGGATLGRREAVRALAIAKADVPVVPRRTRIVVAEIEGGTTRTWEVDTVDQIEADCTRVLVVPTPEAS